MKFVRAIWKLLVGIKDALVLLFMLLFFGSLYAGLSVRPAPVKDGVLDLDLKGSLVEQPVEADWSDVAGGASAAASPPRCHRRSRRGARRQQGESGRARPRQLRRRRSDCRRRPRATRSAGCGLGKPVVAYATGYTNESYQLAAAASEVWLNPLGAVASRARAARTCISRACSTSSGVTANVYRVGTYKAAVEPFIRNDMSPEAQAKPSGARPGDARNLAREHPRGAAQANVDLFLQRHERRDRGRGRRHG